MKIEKLALNESIFETADGTAVPVQGVVDASLTIADKEIEEKTAHKKEVVDELNKNADEAFTYEKKNTPKLELDESLFEEYVEDDTLNENKEEKTELDKLIESIDSQNKLISAVKDFEPWEGAVDVYQQIVDAGKIDNLQSLVDELYPEGISEVDLNDLLWFERDWVFSMLEIPVED